jgi:antibiotic biosynthesis monooxygenase (ABM) superfamily enzyme
MRRAYGNSNWPVAFAVDAVAVSNQPVGIARRKETVMTESSAPVARATCPAAPAAPSVHRRAVLTWIAVYGAITAAQLLLGDLIGALPMPLRTLVLTGLVVPLVVYVLVPRLLRLDAAVTRRGARR